MGPTIRPPHRRQQRRRLARREVLWTAAAFLFIQGLFVVALDFRGLAVLDPEGGTRLQMIQSRHAERPEQPVLAMIGSSRVTYAFRPDDLPELHTPTGAEVLPFNYGHLGAGPRMNLLLLRRLLRAGVKPRWLLVEVIPEQLHKEGTHGLIATLPDLPDVVPHHARPYKVVYDYARSRLNVFHKYRQGVLREYAPAFATSVSARDHIKLQPLGSDDGWLHPDLTPPRRGKTWNHSHGFARADTLAQMPIDADSARCMRTLLTDCQARDIHVSLVLAPEDSHLRAAYSAQAQERFNAFLAELQSEFGVPVIDARAWVPDEEFEDAQHVHRSGAVTFTQRLHREVIVPLVSGEAGLRSAPSRSDCPRD